MKETASMCPYKQQLNSHSIRLASWFEGQGLFVQSLFFWGRESDLPNIVICVLALLTKVKVTLALCELFGRVSSQDTCLQSITGFTPV